MREKALKLIVTFQTTAAAIAMERLCGEFGVPGRLIPVPREITAGCGMAWCAPVEEKPRVKAFLETASFQAVRLYEMMV